MLKEDIGTGNIAYGVGVRELVKWDEDMANYGYDVYMYDTDNPPVNLTHPKLHFNKIGLCGNKKRSFKIKTLYDLMKKNGHLNKTNLILKMDYEGCEWETLNDFPEEYFKNFKEILVEFHFDLKKNSQICNFQLLES